MNRAEKRHQHKLARKAAKRDRAAQPVSHGHATNGNLALDPSGLVDQGMRLHMAGRIQEAEAIYRQVLAMEQDHADANHLLGGLAHQMGNLALAEDLMSRAIATAPNEPLYHFNLGNVYQGQAQLDDAAASFRRAVTLNPGYAEAHNNLGLVFAEQGQMEGAAASFDKALAARPGWAEVHASRGNALYKLGLMEAAAASYRKALAGMPHNVEIHSNLGSALKELGQYDVAALCFEQAVALKPEIAEAHGKLAVTFENLGRLDDAADSCRTALALKPDSAELHGNLGNVLQRMGRLEDAAASYRAALAIEPDFAIVWNNLKSTMKALEFGAGKADSGLGPVDGDGGQFRLFEHYLDKFRPHEAGHSFKTAMAALPPALDRPLNIDGGKGDADNPSPLADQLIGLLHFGRSGTGLLHSLIDNHPDISTLPSIYLRGFFNADVWAPLTAQGWRATPDNFMAMFDVLFDANSGKPTPGIMLEKNTYLGVKEGMTTLGENRDESLSVDRELFRAETLRLMEQRREIDPKTFLLIVHAAYEKALGSATHKHTTFYHIHNPDDFAKLNFLRCAPDARLVMMVREPLQSCESWLRATVENNDYATAVDQIIAMFFAVDQIPFRTQDAVGVRLEDLKSRPEATMAALCAWMGVTETPSLYEMTAQGMKWWGDPSSPDFEAGRQMSPFGGVTMKRRVGEIFSDSDQLVLGTLFYPFSVRFGYRDDDPAAFKRNLAAIRPSLDLMLDFETAMADRAETGHDQFMASGAFRLLHASLIDRWSILDEFGDYPGLLTPLEITGP
jgi:tetratricopeptide (TPR) repeat protein